MKTLMQAVRGTLEGAHLTHGRLLCAVSGGSDSMALLHALCRLRQSMPFELMASHVQHGLRGEASQLDEQFVRKSCEALHVPLLVESAGLDGSMEDPGMETRARDCRRRIFERQMQTHRMDALLLAHHMDDQTETVLMHLLRGAGMEGLCGMRAVVPYGCGVAVRPLLTVSKQAIVEALAAEGLAYRDDHTNFETVTPRNTLRLQMLPQLETLFPGAGAHIAQAAHTLQADEAFLAQQADALYHRVLYAAPPLFLLDRAALLDAPEALTRRALRRWWQEGLALAGRTPDERTLSFADTASLLALLHEGGSLNLPCGLLAEASQRHLHLLYQSGEPLKQAQPYEVPVAANEVLYRLPHVHITQQPADQTIPRTSSAAVLSPAVQALGPVFRPARPGDRIHPMGAPGSKPLRRFFTDRKIDPVLRPALCVLAAGDDVLWIPSVCTAEALRLSAVPDGSVRLDGAMMF